MKTSSSRGVIQLIQEIVWTIPTKTISNTENKQKNEMILYVKVKIHSSYFNQINCINILLYPNTYLKL